MHVALAAGEMLGDGGRLRRGPELVVDFGEPLKVTASLDGKAVFVLLIDVAAMGCRLFSLFLDVARHLDESTRATRRGGLLTLPRLFFSRLYWHTYSSSAKRSVRRWRVCSSFAYQCIANTATGRCTSSACGGSGRTLDSLSASRGRCLCARGGSALAWACPWRRWGTDGEAARGGSHGGHRGNLGAVMRYLGSRGAAWVDLDCRGATSVRVQRSWSWRAVTRVSICGLSLPCGHEASRSEITAAVNIARLQPLIDAVEDRRADLGHLPRRPVSGRPVGGAGQGAGWPSV